MERDELEARRRLRRARAARGRPIQVVVIDPYPIERYGITLILQTQPDIEVVAQADGADEAMVHAARLRDEPGVVFLVSMELSGKREAERCVQAIRRYSRQIPLVLYNAEGDRARPPIGRQAVEGVLHRGVHPADLLDTVRHAVRGDTNGQVTVFGAEGGPGSSGENGPKAR